jgi:predicted RNase H-like nuclease (RuvC/YqgF family)
MRSMDEVVRDLVAEIKEQQAEIERLRERIKDAEKAMEHWGSKPVQDYYKKYPDPVDADIGPCDH